MADSYAEGFHTVSEIRLGQTNEEFDAWLFGMLVDNNILHAINPHIIASPEQLAFMVHLEPNQIYVPCSDRMFFELAKKQISPLIRREYGRAWRIIMEFLQTMPFTEAKKRRVTRFCRDRFKKSFVFHDLLPARVMKRLTSIVLSPNEVLEDPWIELRQTDTAWQAQVLQLDFVQRALNKVPENLNAQNLETLLYHCTLVEFARLACFAANARMWAPSLPQEAALEKTLRQAERVCARCLRDASVLPKQGTVLLLADGDGGTLYDIRLAKFLVENGYKVIYAVKEDFYFHAPTLRDMTEDPLLRQELKAFYVCDEPQLSKNELLRLLREWRLVVISDGTRERLNLLRVSVTFSRAWKEADLILAHGWRLRDQLLETSASFTRDVFCWWQDETGFHAQFKPHAPQARKFSETDIARLADAIIADMKQARDSGRPVMFYSCIIGSIPGQTKTAIRLVMALVQDLRERLPQLYVVNPAEHFVEGMDGDDLMYMWERVQRSGLINIWHFQTSEDIERGFALLGEIVPKEWVGKDATYSTGCTKEMRIALSVQQENPEMQIVGPDPDRFFRRSDYGVGKYFDASLVHR